MSDPMILPLEALSDACASQLLIVRREWPQGVPLTPLTAQRAVELGLDLEWIADHLLDAPAWADYTRITAKAKAEYERATAPAWADYTRVTAKAWANYDRATAKALAKYTRVTAKAWAKYDRATAKALAKYTRVRAKALADYAPVAAPALLDGVIQTLKRKGTR